MATNPSALVPMAMGDSRAQLSPTPDNPQRLTPEQSLEQLGISEDDKKVLVEIITDYRTQWAPDRLLRMPDWMRNDWMYRGRQILGWDQQGGCWYDALAEYMQAGSPDGDASYLLDRFKNNITKMLGTAFVGTMSRSVPPTVIRPENADVEADVTTAKAAQESISIIERFNDIKGLVRDQNTKLYLFGSYFKWTRPVVDGAWAGYDEEPVYGDVPRTIPDRYHCSQCGEDTPVERSANIPGGSTEAPADNQGVSDGMGSPAPPPEEGTAGKACASCGSVLGPADFYPSEQTTDYKQTGTKKIPRAMIKWTIHGPLEIDANPQAKKIADTPILALDMEVDIGTLRRTFASCADKIQEGAETSTTPNAGFERLRRMESYAYGNAYTADSGNQQPTYSQVWMQPDAYYRKGNGETVGGLTFPERMMKAAPEGLKVSMVGDQTVDVRKACLEKEWTACVLIEGCGLYPPSPADDVVGFNVRINGAMDQIDDHYETSAHGIVLADSSMIDRREIKDERMVSGRLNFVKKKGGQDQALSNALWQMKLEMDSGILNYVPMLASLAQQIAALPPQIFGVGTQPNVDTAKGQAQQLDQAQISLNVFFENEKAEHAMASQNAIEWLQKCFKMGLIHEIWDVVESAGSQFRNNYVNLEKMNGRISVYPVPDQGLPQSPEQQRQTHQMIIEEAGKGNPLALEMMDSVPNQEVMVASLCGSDMELPSADQRARTTQHINILLETPVEECPKVVTPVDPQNPGADPQVVPDLPVKPEIGTDNWKVLKDTIKQFRCKNWDGQRKNLFGWSQLDKYYKLAEQLEMQEAVDDAKRKMTVMSAGAPAPDDAVERARIMLLSAAAQAIPRLQAVGAIDPMMAMTGKALPAVVSADKELLDAGLKAATTK